MTGPKDETPKPGRAKGFHKPNQNEHRESTAPGTFPAKQSSVVAEVLARLLNHERLTSLNAVTNASTTCLSAVVFYLAGNYGWTIDRIDKAIGCNDGRVAWVSEYFIHAGTVALAMAAGAADWCADVHAARRALRTKAAEARNKAARENAARKNRPHPGQWGLFDGGANG